MRAGFTPPPLLAWLLAAALAGGCGGGGGATAGAPPPAAGTVAQWRRGPHITAVVDVAARPDNRLVVAAAGRLGLLAPPARLQPLPGGYATAQGPEPYIALSPGQAVPGAGCAFPRDTVYALEPQGRPGVIAVDPAGRPRRFVDLRGAGLLSGIAFDTTGGFGHRLIVTATRAGRTRVFAVDCRGRPRVVARVAPHVEGGMTVAPPGFGPFAGRLIAPDENSGRVFAIAPDGRSSLVAASGLPHGGDIGVESAAFVPAGLTASWTAYLADRVSRGNPHPGDDVLLTLSGRELLSAGVRPGDLLVAAEGGAKTIAVRCAGSCTVRHVADGPAIAHVEGHIAFLPGR